MNGLRPPLTAAACFALWQTRRLSPRVLNRLNGFYGKVRGIKSAIRKTVETVMHHIQNGADYDGKLYISYSDYYALVEGTRNELAAQMGIEPERIPILDIGTIIASHCGPGTVAVFYYGDERSE